MFFQYDVKADKRKTRNVQGAAMQQHGRSILPIIVLLAFLGLSGIASFAQVQSSGTISGHIADATGASIAKAQVVITAQRTGVSTTTVTNSSGYYSVPQLRPGIYSIRVKSPGFKTSISSSLDLAPAKRTPYSALRRYRRSSEDGAFTVCV